MAKNSPSAEQTVPKNIFKPHTEYAVFIKRNRRNLYQFSSLNEDELRRDLAQMYREHCNKYRYIEDDKKIPPFTAFGLVIDGHNSRLVNVSFSENDNDEETYEDVVNRENP